MNAKQWTCVALTTAFAVGTVQAQTTYTWTQTAGGAQAWTTGANWSEGLAPSPVSGDTVDFSTVNIGAHTTLSLGADRTAEVWKFGDTNSGQDWIVASGNTITLAGTTPTINVVNRTTTLNCVLDGTAGLTKDGAATLVLGNTANIYSGGTVINTGTLQVGSDGNLGDASGSITLNGGQLRTGNITIARDIIIGAAGGWFYTTGNGNFATTGTLTGSGTLTHTAIGGSGKRSLSFKAANNDFTGAIMLLNAYATVTVNSLADSGNRIVFNNWTTPTFALGSGDASPLLFNSRQIELAGTTSGAKINNDNTTDTNTITINTDLLVSTAGNKMLTLGGSNTGTNTFAGNIVDGTGAVISLTKEGNGKWILSGNNTFSGTTTVTAGTLVFDTVNPMTNPASLYLPSASSKNITLNSDLNVARLFIGGVEYPAGTYSSSGAGSAWMNTGIGVLTVGATEGQPLYWDSNDATSGTGSATPTGTWGTDSFWSSSYAGDAATAAWTAGRTAAFAAGSDAAGSYTVTVSGVQDIGGLTFEEGTVTLSGGTALRLVTNTSVNVAAGLTATVETVLSEDAAPRNFISTGQGTLILRGANTYSGTTTVDGGTLTIANATAISSNLVVQGGNVTFSTDASMDTLIFNSSLKRTVTGSGTLTFNPGGSITVNSSMTGNWGETAALSLPISNSPSVTLNTGGNVETVFAPTAGTISLGTISGAGLIQLGGSTTGNSIAGSASNKIRVSGGEWTLLGNARAYQHWVNDGTLIVNNGVALTATNDKGINLSTNATLVVNGTVGDATTKGISFAGSTEGASPWNVARPGGTLTGTGVVNQTVTLNVLAQATVAPGYPAGTLTVTNCDCIIAGKLAIAIDGASCGTLAVPGRALDISSGTLDVNIAGASATEYVIATYSSLSNSMPFAATNNLPSSWEVVYEATQIKLVAPPGGTVFRFY